MLPLHVAVESPMTEALLTGAYALVVGTATTAYLVGESSLRQGGAWRASRRVAQPLAFLAGSAAVSITVLPPLDGVLERTLTGHMVQHMVLVLVAAPLLVLGRPGPRFMRAVGPRSAGRLVRATTVGAGARLSHALASPTAAWVGFAALLWAWHAPAVFDLAADDAAVHAAQHASLLAAAVLCARTLVAPPRGASMPPGAAVIAVAATGMHSGVLGALLVFAPRPLYAVYADHPLGVALRDQQLAGALMWVGAAPIFLGAVAVVVLRALAQAEPEPVIVRAEERSTA